MLIEEAIAAGWDVEAQFVAPGAQPVDGSSATILDLAPHVLERVASTETPPRTVLAIVRRPATTMTDLAGSSLVVVCDRISDPGNLGTIIRSAEAAGVDGLVLLSGTVDPLNPKVVRSSAGSLFHVPVLDDVSLPELRDLGLPLFGTSSHTGTPITEADLTAPFALVMGSEAHGVDEQIPIDSWLTIPHAGRAESLNVAMATTLIVFEAVRQRRGR
jgi:TrmH family RNA methyltransferase